MLTFLRRAWRRGQRAAPSSDKSADAPTSSVAQQEILVTLLKRAEAHGRIYQLRDLHKETSLTQSQVLRAINELQSRGTVTLHGGQFDPLSGLVRLNGAKN